MAREFAGERKFAELVAHHVLDDEHRNMLLAVMNTEGEPNHLRRNRRRTVPRLDDGLRSRACLLDFLKKLWLGERTFFETARHRLEGVALAAANNEFVASKMAATRFDTESMLAPLGLRVLHTYCFLTLTT